jgi:hypothetical protein
MSARLSSSSPARWTDRSTKRRRLGSRQARRIQVGGAKPRKNDTTAINASTWPRIESVAVVSSVPRRRVTMAAMKKTAPAATAVILERVIPRDRRAAVANAYAAYPPTPMNQPIRSSSTIWGCASSAEKPSAATTMSAIPPAHWTQRGVPLKSSTSRIIANGATLMRATVVPSTHAASRPYHSAT